MSDHPTERQWRGAPLLDVAISLAGRPCLVVGGGAVAGRRIARLLDAGAQVTVVSPTLSLPLSVDSTSIRWIERAYAAGDVQGMALVVTATGVAEVDAAVTAEAQAAGILVNDASDAGRGDVVVPARTTDGDVTITIRTGSPALSAAIRRRIDAEWSGIGQVAELMAEVRAELIAAGRSTTHPGWEAAIDDGVLDLVRSGKGDEARRLLRHHLDLEQSDPLSG